MNRHLRHFRAAIASFVIAAAANAAAADEGETPRAEPHVWRPSLVAASNPAATDLLARVQADTPSLSVFRWEPTPDCPRIDVRVYLLTLVPAPASEPADWGYYCLPHNERNQPAETELEPDEAAK